MTRFGPIRKRALKYWALQTGRTIHDTSGGYLLTDTFEGAYECDWQNRYTPGHVNLFCSLGDWACNLTDIFKDDKYDNFNLDNPDHATVIFRYYTRLMLVISELLTDFQDMYLKAITPAGQNKSVARTFYFPNETPDRISKVLNYINHTCKHKTQHIHVCNGHIPIIFQDSSQRRPLHTYVSIIDTTTTGKNAILVPELEYLLKTVMTCYRKLNSYFKTHPTQFNALCVNFS